MGVSKVISARQRGFSLIELMVGVVVGLLAVLVITQVMTLAEGKKRTVSMGSDAQVNGALALFTMQRDIEQSGYGAVANPDALGCTVNYQFGTAGTAKTLTLAPVVITDGGSTKASDTIAILQGNTTNFSAPVLLTGIANQADDHFTVSSSFGVAAGNMMIAVPQTWSSTSPCGLFSVTTLTTPATAVLTSTNVPHGSGSQWNQSTVFPSAGLPANSYLVNMGAMVYRTYSVSGSGNLQGADLSLADGTQTAQDLYPQIVMMQALYGKDTHNTGSIDAYNKTAPATNADWKQVLAIRIAVVARSNQYEKDVVTSTAPQWDVGSLATVSGTTTCNTSSLCVSLDVSSIPDWQHYRYKIYDTTIPLRNVLWSK